MTHKELINICEFIMKFSNNVQKFEPENLKICANLGWILPNLSLENDDKTKICDNLLDRYNSTIVNMSQDCKMLIKILMDAFKNPLISNINNMEKTYMFECSDDIVLNAWIFLQNISKN